MQPNHTGKKMDRGLAPLSSQGPRGDERFSNKQFPKSTGFVLPPIQSRKTVGIDHGAALWNSVALQDHLVRNLHLEDLLTPTYAVLPQHGHTRKKNPRPLHLRVVERAKRTTISHIERTRKLNATNPYEMSETERLLDPLPSSLTLAQRLDLVPKPAERLDRAGWDEVKQRFLREDVESPCPICQEKFTVDDQVLLSCSHAFHRKCLESYERFVKQRCCPLCRHLNYEKMLILEGKRRYIRECATKIQKYWRGYRVRKIYEEYRSNHIPDHAILRKKYFFQKLRKLTDQLVLRCNSEKSSLDSLFRTVDKNLEESRRVMERLYLDANCHDLALELHFDENQLDSISKSENDWDAIYLLAVSRGHLVEDSLCPICLNQLQPVQPSTKRKRPISILSCSHVFHDKCLDCFESFVECDVGISCPVCRTKYYRKTNLP
ncbi:hypothetical protein BJ742DRAFT_801185 [Cladochytrium replicatum]|nr:hypothetical protein BJ742DRAFT_801185 [Cladochytrium replicatum]